jgi:hypothetical protein
MLQYSISIAMPCPLGAVWGAAWQAGGMLVKAATGCAA